MQPTGIPKCWPILVLALASCRAEDAKPEAQKPVSKPEAQARGSFEESLPVPKDHDDIAIDAKIEGGELVVTMTAESGGHALTNRGAKVVGDHIEAQIQLTRPGRNEPTTDGFEDLRTAVPLPEGRQPVQVLLQQVLRGAKYQSEPPFVLRHTLKR